MSHYECPECGGEIVIEQDNLTYTECPNCKAKLAIDVDAEFVDGRWKDLTKLTKV